MSKYLEITKSTIIRDLVQIWSTERADSINVHDNRLLLVHVSLKIHVLVQFGTIEFLRRLPK